MRFRLALLLILVILLAWPVFGIGIASNAPDTILFKPNLEVTYTFRVRDESGRGMTPYVAEWGHFKEYVTLSELRQIDPIWYEFTATIRFPESIEKGGKYTIYIGAVEGTLEQKVLGARARVQVAINVYVLHQFKAVEASFSAPDVNINETAHMSLKVLSITEQDINSVKAKIQVYGAANNLIETLYTDERPLKSNTEEEFIIDFDTRGQAPGSYYANATLYWDENVTYLGSTFRIGELNVKIIDYSKEFKKDSIEKFVIQVESGWNNLLRDVYGDIYVDGGYRFRTPGLDLKPWTRESIETYWDTKGLEPGKHNITIELFYNDREKEGKTIEQGQITILEEAGPREMPGKVEILGKFLSTTTLLIIIIILLLIFNIIFIVKKSKKK